MAIPDDVIAMVPRELAEKHALIPIRRVQQELLVAMTNPADLNACDALIFITGLNIQIAVASERDIQRAIAKHYAPSDLGDSGSPPTMEQLEKELPSNPAKSDLRGGLNSIGAAGEAIHVISQGEREPDSEVKDVAALLNLAETPPIVRFANAMLTDAIKLRASDVHVEPQDTGVLIRYRVDGIMREMVKIDRHLHAPLVCRIKTLAKMDISERRKPQAGRYHIRFRERFMPCLAD